MRFIHTADLHRGAKPDADKAWGSSRADAVRDALARFVALCNEEAVDLLLIAGDLFHRPPARAELKEVDYLFSQLKNTRVALIAGNHDFVRPGSAYAEHAFPENVYFLRSPRLSSLYFEDLNLAIYGFSYDAEIMKNDAMLQFTPPDDGRRHILMIHGGDAEHLPFKQSQLLKAGWDYVALGHIHRPFLSGDGRIAMPGTPEPLDRTETGEHGYYLGELGEGYFSLDWRPFSAFEYTDLKISVTPDMTQEALLALLRKRMKTDYSEVYRILLTGRRDPALSFDKEALARLGAVSEVADETLPEYYWDSIRQRADHDILFRTFKALSPAEGETDALKEKALYYAVDALLASDKRGAQEALR